MAFLRNPYLQFDDWFETALRYPINLAEGMVLSTVDTSNMPDARVVLLKKISPAGLVFFTHYDSAKGKQLESNPKASAVFWWPELERQIRIRGHVSPISAAESDTYFKSRPRGSQIGAWCSPQSQVLEDRSVLEKSYQKLEQHYQGQEIPRPGRWGGYCLSPVYFEFWQGGGHRLHDRFAYSLDADQGWEIDRLGP